MISLSERKIKREANKIIAMSIKDAIKKKNIRFNTVAKDLHINKTYFSAVINGHRTATTSFIQKVEEYIGEKLPQAHSI